LKNITEQIYVIEENRDIDAACLKKYLPENNNDKLPAIFMGREQKSFASEREILYQVLFDMKKDMTDLKKIVHHLISKDNVDFGEIKDNAMVIHDIPHTVKFSTDEMPKNNISNIEDTENYVIEESLSLEEIEKDVIRKALEKHGGRRKDAADELKISERTLYRKIKEYDL